MYFVERPNPVEFYNYLKSYPKEINKQNLTLLKESIRNRFFTLERDLITFYGIKLTKESIGQDQLTPITIHLTFAFKKTLEKTAKQYEDLVMGLTNDRDLYNSIPGIVQSSLITIAGAYSWINEKLKSKSLEKAKEENSKNVLKKILELNPTTMILENQFKLNRTMATSLQNIRATKLENFKSHIRLIRLRTQNLRAIEKVRK